MGKGCLKCAGQVNMANGQICPDCSKEKVSVKYHVAGIPVQYQGKVFDRDFLPNELIKSPYADFMEKLYDDITQNISIFQKNYLIVSRPNSGKTIWAYSLLTQLISSGYKVPLLRDISEVKNVLNFQESVEEADLYSKARCVIVKIPSDAAPWLFDCMRSLIERRVRNNGFTIFLYSGSMEELERADRHNILRDIRGTGAFNTVAVKDYGRKNQ